MNRSQRIRIDINNPNVDKYLKVKLEQNIDFLELLTLNLKTKEIYRNFNADYGVLIGRVIANNGIGIPNAKISIFIPLNEEDEKNEKIRAIYPYKTPNDRNLVGKKYNLLPRVSEIDSISGLHKPKQPFGTFPIKPEIVTNRTLYEVYKKYYKYTTTTNEFGDYMIFGAPIGLHTVHMSVDITDIGRFSMTPNEMINILGYSENLFIKENGEYTIKPTTNLEDLPHIETQEISINIRPFWGDKNRFEIGFTRQDFRIKATIESSFIVFGQVFIDGDNITWGTPESQPNELDFTNLYKIHDTSEPNLPDNNLLEKLEFYNKSTRRINEKIFYYPNTISEDKIYNNQTEVDGSDYILATNANGDYDIKKNDNGCFTIKLYCNRRKVIFDDLGNEIEVNESYPGGIYTRFIGFITIDTSGQDHVPNPSPQHIYNSFRTRIKIPQFNESAAHENSQYHPQAYNTSFNYKSLKSFHTPLWIRQVKTFTYGKIYTVAKFNPTVFNDVGFGDEVIDPVNPSDPEIQHSFLENDHRNNLTKNPIKNVGVIRSSNDTLFPYNNVNNKCFGSNWLNFSIYLPHITSFKAPQDGFYVDDYKHFFTNTYFSGFRCQYTIPENPYSKNEVLDDLLDNGTARFLRMDIHWTDFIEVPLNDIININEAIESGEITNFNFKLSEFNNLRGEEYKGGSDSCPYGGGRINGDIYEDVDPDKYFYLGGSIQHLLDSNFL